MRCPALLLPLLLSACGGGGGAAEPDANESTRITGQIHNQAAQIVQQAENGTVEIERAMENEGAAIFENRAALLNETAADTPANSGADAGNSAR